MKKINKIIGYLPIALYFECIALLLCYCFVFNAILDYLDSLELIDYFACTFCLIHALFNFKEYHYFAKSSFIMMFSIVALNLLYYTFEITNLDYYFCYILILTVNAVYGILKAR